MLWQLQRGVKLCNLLTLVRYCLCVWQHAQGKERKAEQQAARRLKLQLKQWNNPCQQQLLLFRTKNSRTNQFTWWGMRTPKTRGRDRAGHYHLIPIHGWALRHTKRLQPPACEPYSSGCLMLGYRGKRCNTRWQWSQAIRMPILECRHWPGDSEKTRNSQVSASNSCQVWWRGIFAQTNF